MSDIAGKIAEAKKQVETLRKQIEKEKGRVNDDASLSQVKVDTAISGQPKVRRVLKGHFGKVYAMHWAGNGTDLVSASQDGKLIIWNGHTTHKSQAIPLRSSWVMTCAFEQNENQMVACGGLDNLCSIYTLNQPQVMRATQELAAHDGYLSCCRFVDSSRILTASGDSTCILWDVSRGEALQTFSDHGGDVMSLALSPTSLDVFVSGSCDASSKLWDTRTGKCTHTFYGHDSDINSVAFFPDGNAFGTGSDDSSCRIFDVRAYAEVGKFEGEKISCGITSVAFSLSGRLLFAGYDDYNCYSWDVTKESAPVHKLDSHENRVSCLGVAPTGEALCSGSWDTLLKIWA